MDEDDILSELDNFKELKAESNPKPKPSFNPQDRKWPWDEPGFIPTKLDPEKFNKIGKYYTIFYSNASDVDDDMINKFMKIAKVLLLKGYTLRHRGSAQDKIWNDIISVEGIKYDSYLPWKKFNPNIKKPKRTNVEKEAYQHLAFYNKNFDKLKPGLRGIISTEFYTLLSDTLDNPCDLILVYTPKGDETINKETDYKSIGNASLGIRIAGIAGIPVINLAKEDAVARLSELLKSKEQVEESKSEEK